MNIIQKPSPYFGSRHGYRPEAIVIHVMEGTLHGTDEFFQQPGREEETSAHFGIGKTGEIHQYVDEEDAAFHAGRVSAPTWPLLKPRNINPNWYTIGIEHEGTATSFWPDAMYEASAELCAQICRRWGIPADRLHFVKHHEIYAPKSCPGVGNVDHLVALVAKRLGTAVVPVGPARRVLKMGARGDDVKLLQIKLGMQQQTGFFGPTTERNVKTFQTSKGMKADGVVGPKTWAALGV